MCLYDLYWMLCRTSDENKPHILKIPYCILLGHKKKCGQIIEFTIWAVYNHSSTKFQLQYVCRLLEQFPNISKFWKLNICRAISRVIGSKHVVELSAGIFIHCAFYGRLLSTIVNYEYFVIIRPSFPNFETENKKTKLVVTNATRQLSMILKIWRRFVQ